MWEKFSAGFVKAYYEMYGLQTDYFKGYNSDTSLVFLPDILVKLLK